MMGKAAPLNSVEWIDDKFEYEIDYLRISYIASGLEANIRVLVT